MFYAFIYSSNKLSPTILKAFNSQSEVDEFIQLFKLSPIDEDDSSGAGIDLYIQMDCYHLSDSSLFKSLSSNSIDNHLRYSKFVRVAIVNSYDELNDSHFELYQILDQFEVY